MDERYKRHYSTASMTDETEIQRLCREENDARYAKKEAEAATLSAVRRYVQAQKEVRKYNKRLEKCSCPPVCASCGKEK